MGRVNLLPAILTVLPPKSALSVNLDIEKPIFYNQISNNITGVLEYVVGMLNSYMYAKH